MSKSSQDNMTGMGYYFSSVIRYWKVMLKIVLNRIEWSEITVDELLARINSSDPPLILDIRAAEHFNGADGHIPNAKLITISHINSILETLQPFKEREIITVCPGGGLSLAAADILEKADFKDVKSLHGGMDMWVKKGYPTEQSKI